MRLAEYNRREIVLRRRHTPIQNSSQQTLFWTLARRFIPNGVKRRLTLLGLSGVKVDGITVSRS
jgi:hypothetical protein